MQKAVELNPRVNFLDTLAAAYAETGKFADAADAIEIQKRVIVLLNSFPSVYLIFCVSVFRAAPPHHPAFGIGQEEIPFLSAFITWVTSGSSGAFILLFS